MALLDDNRIRSRDDIARFEAELTLEQRLPERSVLDVFIGGAARWPERTAMTMLMSGAPDEQPRRVELRRAARPGAAGGEPFRQRGRGASRRRLHAAEPGRDARDAVGRPERGVCGADQLPAAARAYRRVARGLRRQHPRRARPAPGARHLAEGARAARADAGPDRWCVSPRPVHRWREACSTSTLRWRNSPTIAWSSASPAATTTWQPTSTPAAPRVRPGWWRTRTAASWWLHLAAPCSATCARAIPSWPACRCSTWAARSSADSAPSWPEPACWSCRRAGCAIRRWCRASGAWPSNIARRSSVPCPPRWAPCSRCRSTEPTSTPCGPASPAPRRCRRRWASASAQVTGRGLFEVYGMTEASGIIAIDPVAGGGGAGSVGWALPYTEVVVRRLEADGRLGAPCETGEIGVITVRGPHVSPGYRNPEHDAGVLDGGMLDSGDLGYIDEERPHPHRRPRQGPDHPQRPQHRPADDRERDGRAPGRRAGRRRGHARRLCRRAAGVLRDAACRAPRPARTSCTSTRSARSASARRGRSTSTSSRRSR